MTTYPLQVLLADDDEDDCLFFAEALAEQPAATALTAVHDGEQLMDLLRQPQTTLPHVLFLDLNMPRLSGYECLAEIKRDGQLRQLPVVILSTFFAPDVEKTLLSLGAVCCLQKPTNLQSLRDVIGQAIERVMQQTRVLVAPEDDVPAHPTTSAS